MLMLALRIIFDARVASQLVGGPWLVAICEREAPRCQLVSIHKGDQWMERSLGEGWSTRGAHGNVAKYAWPHVPWWASWMGPVALDIPLVSAITSNRRAHNPKCDKAPACRAWRGW